MNREELIEKFPKLEKLVYSISDLSKDDKRTTGGQILLCVLSALSEDDGDMLSLVERLEHNLNKDMGTINPINKLAMLSRLRYKINKAWDHSLYG